MNWRVLCLIVVALCTFGHLEAQSKRICEVEAVITAPNSGYDTFTSPGKQMVHVAIINNGPDTIIPEDQYSIGFKFGGNQIFPKFLKVKSHIAPGDSIKHSREIKVEYRTSIEFKFCTDVLVYSTGMDSMKLETPGERENNMYCISAYHLDNYPVSVPTLISDNGISLFPNPSNLSVRVQSVYELERIEVNNLFGQKIEDIKLGAGTLELDLSTADWPSALYLVNVYMSDGSHLVKRIQVFH